jgi:hypothetical protein
VTGDDAGEMDGAIWAEVCEMPGLKSETVGAAFLMMKRRKMIIMNLEFTHGGRDGKETAIHAQSQAV